jgi:peptide/nickel transport system substrate-binding protein
MMGPKRMLVAAALAAAALAGCGAGDDDGGGGEGKSGGEFVVAFSSQPDFLDPAQSYLVDGWVAMWPVYLTPVGYKHVEGPEGSELTPLLAEELPKASMGGRVYSFRFRDGIEYSDGTPLKASDFEHSIKRVLALESGGAFYYEKIRGADEFVKAGDPERADISGIETNDRTREVKVTLTRPDGTFPSVLGLQFSGVVPSTTPFENVTKNPPPGTGSFKITSSVPNRQFVLEKNQRYQPIDGFPEAKADKLTFKIIKSLDRAAQDTIRGRVDALHEPPPPDLQPEIRARYADRYKSGTTQSTYYFFLNEKLPPFDDEKARQAVNLGIDKPALARLYGAGLFEPGCNFLPPGIPGYRRIDPCPWGDPRKAPDLAKARRALRESSYDGRKVTVWGNNEDPAQKVTEAYAQMLNEIGFKAEPRIIDGGVYEATVGNEKTRAQTGFANWFADFPSPANYMFLVNGKSIQPTNNRNWGNVDVPELTRRITKLEATPNPSDVAEEWAEADRMVVEGAHGVPYGQRKITTFVSERVDFANCALFHSLYQTDYSSLCSK